MPPDITLEEARARVRAMYIDRLADRLRAHWTLWSDIDPVAVEELADALAPLPEPVIYPESEDAA